MTTKQLAQPNIKQSFKPVTKSKNIQPQKIITPTESITPPNNPSIMESPEARSREPVMQNQQLFFDKGLAAMYFNQGDNSTSIPFANMKNESLRMYGLPNINSQTNGFHTNNQPDFQNMQSNMIPIGNIQQQDDYFANSRSIRINENQEENQTGNMFENNQMNNFLLNSNGPNFKFNTKNDLENQSSINQQLLENLDNQQFSKKNIEFKNIKQDRSLTFRGQNPNSKNNFSNSNSTQSSFQNKQKAQFPHKNNNKPQQNQQQLGFQNNQSSFINMINQQKNQPRPVTNFEIKIKQQQEEDDDEEKSKNTRGLRYLSLQVKDIVCQKQKTTYKEVADTLVENLRINSQNNGLSDDEILKDEQNIKRRVYDALNVLIASEVIQKKNKNVTSCENSSLKGRCLQKDNWEKVKEKEKLLQQKKNVIQQKKRIIKDYVEKTLALKNLIKRNKINQQIYSEYKQNSNFQIPENMNKEQLEQIIENEDNSEEKFNFPITQLSFQPEEDSMVLKMSKNKRDLKFFSKKPVYIYGDLDILTNFGFHNVSTEFMEQNIKKDILEKYYVQYQNQIEAQNTSQLTKSLIKEQEINENSNSSQATQKLQKSLNTKRTNKQDLSQTQKKTNKKVKQ